VSKAANPQILRGRKLNLDPTFRINTYYVRGIRIKISIASCLPCPDNYPAGKSRRNPTTQSGDPSHNTDPGYGLIPIIGLEYRSYCAQVGGV